MCQAWSKTFGGEAAVAKLAVEKKQEIDHKNAACSANFRQVHSRGTILLLPVLPSAPRRRLISFRVLF